MMASEAKIQSKHSTEPSQLFQRVLVGVDHSPASTEAARQAAVLTDPDGAMTLLGAWTVPPPVLGVVSPDLSHELDVDVYREAAKEAVVVATTAIGSLATPSAKVVRGFAWDTLCEEADREHATLIVVGSHGQGRLRGILLGSTAADVVHKAPCSVLVARQADEDFPRRVVVGVDGSPQSAAAYTVARRVADRFGSELWPVVAHGDNGVDKESVAAIVGHHREDLPDEPVRALVTASADADLIVVGSRGLHSLRALGSVSERVAHGAHCSALIVRGP